MSNELSKPRLLIVDDDRSVLMLLESLLGDTYSCVTADSAEGAIGLMVSSAFDVVICDINLGGMSGIELLPVISAAYPDIVVLMISGNGSIDAAIGALKAGVFDYLKKPFELDEVEAAVRRALDHHKMLVRKRKHEAELHNLVETRTAELDRLSNYDGLTNLPNRLLFEERVNQAIAASHDDQSVAVMLISLDRFKEARDTFGRSTGNEILRQIAGRLNGYVESNATVARLEAEEFAILLPGGGTKDISTIATEILNILQKPIPVGRRELFAACGMGISLYPGDGLDAEGLIKNSGIALAQAKQRGKNHFQRYNKDMHAKAFERLALENGLRHAVVRNELDVYYQPTVNTASGAIVGCEALLRWEHPELGMILPSLFIPIAEETGLIVEIGEWVLRAACLQGARWHTSGFEIQVAVNVSVHQFGKSFSETVLRTLRETGFDARYLNLEITESALMADPRAAIEMLNQLKKIGVSISIDDFGTGYSSLSHLKRLPIDVLKIDRSFINDVASGRQDATLVTMIAELAGKLHLNVVAEGVETEEQLEFLRELNCGEWQGYLCSKPKSATAFSELLDSHYAAHAPSSLIDPEILSVGALPHQTSKQLHGETVFRRLREVLDPVN